MSETGSVNGQIVDAVTDTATLLTGLAPGQSFSLLDTVMVETLGVSMYNAVTRQHNDGMISTAATTAACARMLTAQPPPPKEPEKKTETTSVNKLDKVQHKDVRAEVDDAFDAAENSLKNLQQQFKQDKGTQDDAMDYLANLTKLVNEMTDEVNGNGKSSGGNSNGNISL